ncbi:hypothetical protein GP486_005169 [Trichoglossum hirsutum]|uniref:Nuclear localization protein n=1 Tax=Trichoglossum hirsutum TaxID=265104 RepID=A0A9P8L9L8_9PEZI|nr:hypothetical protein GP486_005169 [Trichoglossum hirsutum]
MDPSGTINPATLNPAAPAESPRGTKRSRSPEQAYGDATGDVGDDNNDEQKRRKRGRPPKQKPSGGVPPSPGLATPQQTPQPLPNVQTPQLQAQSLPPKSSSATTPHQTSPPRTTPTKTVVKALPTVRDHTTDQLGREGDEYLPREYDEAGEKKVLPTGHLCDGREYRCRTFLVPNRGEKLFMLATECARVLGYRDSYLLFNKNRSLYKIIATQPEKDDLIQQEILPYSYRSRQIAIVTAKSMFRQFGSRVIVNGRRVRDDYWESKAIKQGFTEDDLAGEKRPGAAKARSAAAAEAASASASAGLTHHAEVVYSNGPIHLDSQPQPQTVQPGLGGTAAASIAPLPMIGLTPNNSDDPRMKEITMVPRPRQEITGPPYQDRLQQNSAVDILNQAQHGAEYNKSLSHQRTARTKYHTDFYKEPRIPVTSAPPQQSAASAEQGPPVSQPHRSPQLGSAGMHNPSQPPMTQHSQQASHLVSQPYTAQQQQQQQQHQQNPAQSPIRSVQQGSMRPDQIHHRSPGLVPTTGVTVPGNPYAYPPQNHMWPPPQPQQTPVSQTHTHHGLPQYAPLRQQQTQHPQQAPHPASQPHPPPHGLPQMPGAPVPYQSALPGMGPGGFSAPGGRAIYSHPSQGPQHFMAHNPPPASQPGPQGWTPPQQSPQGQQNWGTWGNNT